MIDLSAPLSVGGVVLRNRVFLAPMSGITDAVFDVLTVKKSAASRKSFGGTAPQEVARQIRHHRRTLGKEG